MKIKNDYVEIKLNNKRYLLKNLVLNTYLESFVESQLPKGAYTNRNLQICLIKFDTKMTFNENSKIRPTQFDIALRDFTAPFSKDSKNSFSETEINIYHNYSTLYYDYEKDGMLTDLSDWVGHKITTLGFATNFNNTVYVSAIVDVNDYNIFVDENSDLTITRKDTFSTNAKFIPIDQDAKFPAHLSPVRDTGSNRKSKKRNNWKNSRFWAW